MTTTSFTIPRKLPTYFDLHLTVISRLCVISQSLSCVIQHGNLYAIRRLLDRLSSNDFRLMHKPKCAPDRVCHRSMHSCKILKATDDGGNCHLFEFIDLEIRPRIG